MVTYKYTDSWGDELEVCFVAMHYYDDSLAVEMAAKYDGEWEPYADITVNLGFGNERHAFLDTNNCPLVPKLLEDNELAEPLGIEMPSGYCMYPMYEFTDKFFAECYKEEEE